MKILIPILFVIILITSCKKQETHYYCWKCNSIVYGKPIEDYFCHEEITEIEAYKLRMIDFYQGGMSTIECTLLPDTVK